MGIGTGTLGFVGHYIDGIRKSLRRRRQAKALLKWQRSGRPVPPPHQVKQAILRKYASKFDTRVLVETGTFLGDMIEAMRDNFDKIYSIELSEEYYAKAKVRFQDCPHVELIRGDSGRELGKLLTRFDQSALFCLDGHYSAGDTARGEKDNPVFEEFEHIIRSAVSTAGHVVLIDDARCFGTDPGYPSLDELQAYLRKKGAQFEFAVEDDVVRITSLRLAVRSEAA